MVERAESVSAAADGAKWLTVAVLMLVALGAFYYFSDYSLLLRTLLLLLVAGAALTIALQTEKGRYAWEFVKEARTEVRKVVWPTRKETLQTTGIVIAMVAIVAVVLWGFDGLLSLVMRRLLGTGG